MKFTSAEANKLLKKLMAERSSIIRREEKTMCFVASPGEDIESVRPSYDYASVRDSIDEIEKKMRTIKHELNKFNVTHDVPGFNMTIDEILVYIPQLSDRLEKLNNMKNMLPKSRVGVSYGHRGGLDYRVSGSGVVEYNYANFDVAKAEEDWNKLHDTLVSAQLALDKLNSTELIEIDIEP